MDPIRNFRLVILLVAVFPTHLMAGPDVDIETGYVFSALNDVRSPGIGGTFLSLADDLATDPAPYLRVQVIGSLGGRHTLRGLYAPLRLQARGIVPRDTVFEEGFFPAGTPVMALYRFDSYRLTWRYGLSRRSNLDMALGLTAKIRDAEIALTGAGRGVKMNTGFVPLFHLHLDWKPRGGRTGLLLDADAAAAKQGRAEDVLLAVTRTVREGVEWRLGYRMLEGGADNPEVYSFAWLHYAVLGLKVDL